MVEMIVRLKDVDGSSGIGVGAGYPSLNNGTCPVLQILLLSQSEVKYRIVDRFGRISFWPADMFDIVDNTIPENWGVSPDGGNGVTIGYERLVRVGFWEDYYDGVPEAVEIVDELLKDPSFPDPDSLR
ncbi:DUF3696 domain-containing protein [Rhodococcus gannanensis]|uniref:DUF3696 domain-containing protein n=1 Tax=Rhodococcus gannanensis TaxID=1960308 RepID=A0ABW4P420_9NOCA